MNIFCHKYNIILKHKKLKTQSICVNISTNCLVTPTAPLEHYSAKKLYKYSKPLLNIKFPEQYYDNHYIFQGKNRSYQGGINNKCLTVFKIS